MPNKNSKNQILAKNFKNLQDLLVNARKNNNFTLNQPAAAMEKLNASMGNLSELIRSFHTVKTPKEASSLLENFIDLLNALFVAINQFKAHQNRNRQSGIRGSKRELNYSEFQNFNNEVICASLDGLVACYSNFLSSDSSLDKSISKLSFFVVSQIQHWQAQLIAIELLVRIAHRNKQNPLKSYLLQNLSSQKNQVEISMRNLLSELIENVDLGKRFAVQATQLLVKWNQAMLVLLATQAADMEDFNGVCAVFIGNTSDFNALQNLNPLKRNVLLVIDNWCMGLGTFDDERGDEVLMTDIPFDKISHISLSSRSEPNSTEKNLLRLEFQLKPKALSRLKFSEKLEKLFGLFNGSTSGTGDVRRKIDEEYEFIIDFEPCELDTSLGTVMERLMAKAGEMPYEGLMFPFVHGTQMTKNAEHTNAETPGLKYKLSLSNVISAKNFSFRNLLREKVQTTRHTTSWVCSQPIQLSSNARGDGDIINTTSEQEKTGVVTPEPNIEAEIDEFSLNNLPGLETETPMNARESAIGSSYDDDDDDGDETYVPSPKGKKKASKKMLNRATRGSKRLSAVKTPPLKKPTNKLDSDVETLSKAKPSSTYSRKKPKSSKKRKYSAKIAEKLSFLKRKNKQESTRTLSNTQQTTNDPHSHQSPSDSIMRTRKTKKQLANVIMASSIENTSPDSLSPLNGNNLNAQKFCSSSKPNSHRTQSSSPVEAGYHQVYSPLLPPDPPSLERNRNQTSIVKKRPGQVFHRISGDMPEIPPLNLGQLDSVIDGCLDDPSGVGNLLFDSFDQADKFEAMPKNDDHLQVIDDPFSAGTFAHQKTKTPLDRNSNLEKSVKHSSSRRHGRGLFDTALHGDLSARQQVNFTRKTAPVPPGSHGSSVELIGAYQKLGETIANQIEEHDVSIDVMKRDLGCGLCKDLERCFHELHARAESEIQKYHGSIGSLVSDYHGKTQSLLNEHQIKTRKIMDLFDEMNY